MSAAPSKNPPPRNNAATQKPGPHGPISLPLAIVMSLATSCIAAFLFGSILEIAGMYTFWKDEGVAHSERRLISDAQYVQQFPRSVPVADTIAFTRQMVLWARWPYEIVGLTRVIQRAHAIQSGQEPANSKSPALLRAIVLEGTRWLEISLNVAQDTAIRASLALFALPGIVLAILIGVVDGLIQRDVRRWSGGRESSFIYHYAKHYAKWIMTVGFAIYLGWPIPGFNPMYQLLTFSVLVAISLSIAVGAFKKYL